MRLTKIAIVLALMPLAQAVFAQASAPAAPAAGTNAATATTIPVGTVNDTIEERSRLALQAEREKAANPPISIMEFSAKKGEAQPIASQNRDSREFFPVKAKPIPEYSLVALRGWSDALEATLVINGKRVTGSKAFPTLTEDWRLTDISQSGVVITKGKERKELAFNGPEPYSMPKSTAGGSQGVTPFGMPASSATPLPMAPLPR